jgi:energy-converting hydrogenase Eha subunit A
MATIHEYIGFVIVSAFGVMFLWGLVAFIVKREPNEWWWRLLAALQVTLIVQLVAGLTLLALGHERPLLHYAYGAVFPAIILVGAHVIARGLDDEADAWKVFAVAGFFLFGLTLRALTTGLGLP